MDEPNAAAGDALGPFQFYEKKNDGVKLHYRTTGKPSSPHKIVFIMGLMASYRSWSNQINFFAQREDEFECLFFDNRGIGFSDVPEGPYSIQQMAHDTIELATEGLGWKQFAVCGASMGGMIAQHVALIANSFPEVEITGLMLVCTRAKSTFWSRLPSFSALFNVVRQRLFVADDDYKSQAELSIPNLYSANYLKDGQFEKEVEKFARMRGERPPDPNTFNFQFAAVKGHELTNEDCQYIKNAIFPVRAISGDADQLLPHQNTLMMEELLGAKVTIVEGVGHGIFIESANLMNDWIVDFISSLES